MSAVSLLDTSLRDLRYAFRTMRRNPVFTVVAVVTLALGIGANTTIFSLINAALVRPLPVASPEELTLIDPSRDFQYSDYVALRDQNGVFTDVIAASRLRPVRIDLGPAGGDAGFAKIVSGNYFAGLGVGPALGRVLVPGDALEPVVVISHEYWTRQLAGSSEVLGRSINLDGEAFTIVGVAPDGFLGEAPGERPDMWASIALQSPDLRDAPGYSWLYLVGRLKPGVSRQQAELALNTIVWEGVTGAPDAEARHIEVAPGARGLPRLRNSFASPLAVSMALVGLVLLIVCTNLASMLLARAPARRKEIAMRQALGAGRRRIVRQLFTESLTLALVGGALGFVLALGGGRFLLLLAPRPSDAPTFELDLAPDLRILLFAAAVSVAAAIMFGLAPALRAAKGGPLSPPSHQRPSRVRDAMIVAQVALSLVLLAGAVMFARTLQNLRNQDLGFSPDDVLSAELAPERGHEPAPTIVPRLLDRVHAIPGVQSATVTASGTLSVNGGVYGIEVDGHTPATAEDQTARADAVGPDYFRTVGTPLLAGRDFTSSDDGDSRLVAIVNETMARFYFADVEAVGRRFTFNDTEYEIVGIAKDAKYTDLREVTPRMVYFPLLQRFGGLGHLELRLNGNDAAAVVAQLREAVREVDPRLSVDRVTTLNARLGQKLSIECLVARLAGLFSGLTLVLVSVGVYGTAAYATVSRTKEIAVRLALGSDRSAVVWVIFRKGVLLWLATGLLLGIGGTLVVSRFVESLLFGLAPNDPATIGLAATILVAVALVAAYVPAFRASRLDPATALRD